MRRKLFWLAAILALLLLFFINRPDRHLTDFRETASAALPSTGEVARAQQPDPQSVLPTISAIGGSNVTGGEQRGKPLRNRLPVRHEVFRVERPLDSRVAFERVRIVETDFRYRLVRFRETVVRDPQTGREEILRSEAMVADHVVVKLRAGQSVASVAAQAETIGLRLRRVVEADRFVLLEFPVVDSDPLPDILTRLRDGAAWSEQAEPDFIVATCEFPDDPGFLNGSQWGLHNTGQAGGVPDQDVNGPEAWSIRSDAAGSIVAIIDTGIRLTHEDLAGNLWQNPGESGAGRESNGVDDDGDGYVDDTHGIDAITGGGEPRDDNGHGTHVAGIVGAVGNNAKGIAGVAWRVQLMPLKFLNSRGVGATSDAISCFIYARRKGAHIINASWGGNGESVLLREVIESCTTAGAVVVAAAGNDGVDLEMAPFYPAAYSISGLLTVASMNRSGALSSFSNYGAVHLAAPGEAVYSAWNESDSSYQLLSGTSMAAPCVSGALALVRQQFSAETPTQRINRIIAASQPSPSLAGRVFYGRRLDLYASLAQTDLAGVPMVEVSTPQSLRIGDSIELTPTVHGTPPFTYQWRLDDRAIPGATHPTLTLTNIQATDRGMYSVVVTNGAASAYSRRIPVIVIGPPTIVTQPTDQDVVAGNDAVLSVASLANGATHLAFQWFHDGVALDANEPTLRLAAVQPIQAGNYRVVVSSQHGVTTSQNAVLTVVPPQAPVIIAEPLSLSVDADHDAAFLVTAAGTETLKYQWLKDGAAIAGETSSSLVLKRAQESDAGVYTVAVSNSGGMVVSHPAQLAVQFAPVAPFIVQPPIAQTVFAGQSAVLAATAKGTPTPVYQWQRNGVDIVGADQPVLTLAKVTAANEGAYRIRVSNSAGTVTSAAASLKVESGFGLQRWEWRNPLPQGNDLFRIIHDDHGFIAVGRFGTIMTSPNAIAWTVRPTPTTETLIDIVSGGHRLVAVGYHGAVLLSDDAGATWSPSLADSGWNLGAVAYGNGLFVAAGYESLPNGYAGVIATSPDGRIWTRRSSGSVESVNTLLFSEGQFLAGDNRGLALLSTDGVHWTDHSTGLGQPLKGFARGNGTFVAVGFTGGIATSPDGKTWTRRLQSSTYLHGVSFLQNTFVVPVVSGHLLTSADGLDWTDRSTGFNGFPYGVTYGAGTFVMVGESGAVCTSPDAMTWTKRISGSTAILQSIACGPPGFVAVGSRSYFSPTGVLWTPLNITGEDVIHADGRYVVLGRSNVAVSSDGRQWTLHEIPGAERNLVSLVYSGDLYVAVGISGKIMSSPDLVNWTERVSNINTTLTDIAYSHGQFVAVGYGGVTLTSPDAVTWSKHASGEAIELNAVACDGQRWVAAGDSCVITTSLDGMNWTRAELPKRGSQPLEEVLYANNQFVVAGGEGTVFTSPDGLRWTERAAGSAVPLFGLCSGKDSFVAVGMNEVILQSGGLAPAQQALTPSPVRQTVQAGQTATLELDTFGTGALEYQWLKEGVPIPNATSPVLQLWNAQPADAGSYSVLARNASTITTSNPAYLAVVSIPESGLRPERGSAAAYIEAPAGYNWTVGTIDPWLYVPSGSAGAGRGNVNFSFAANDTGKPRTGTLVVGGCPMTVEQAGLSVTTQPYSQAANPQGAVTLTAAAYSGIPCRFQWQRNGHDLDGATSSTLVLPGMRPADTGIYSAEITNGNVTLATQSAIVGLVSTSKVTGSAHELTPADIVHPNGNLFDQVLLDGAAASIKADSGQVTRMSFIDLDDDIVQVELSGPGTVSVVLDAASPPARPANYEQDVHYVKGHAGIVVAGGTENTHLSIFSVGRATAFDPTGTFNFLLPLGPANNPANNQSPLFRGHTATTYDGVADIAFLAIVGPSGKFGGLRLANVNCFAHEGITGLYAPDIHFTGPVYLGDVTAFDTATPALVVGSVADFRITGGDLLQMNGQPIRVSGIAHLRFTAGSDSHGNALPARLNQARLEENGVDVTTEIVVNPR